MPCNPNRVWKKMPQCLKSEILENILLVSKEVIHEYIRANYSTTFNTRSDNLHKTINTSSSTEQSRKFGVTVCAETKSN
ncbi:hypothetical protein [Wolbachia endosymbiont (group A) of Urophora cardui]|uniref:hypothetical protein n=1 Tax=Wolbachia endosymbiont (group A) of Urophora cardui TaxID=3066156 RepID=UPI00333FE354